MDREQDRSAPRALSSVEHRPVFNIFRHKLTPDLFCAVPADYPVPGFLHAATWSFAAAASDAAYALGELNWAARTGTRLAGFYFFRSCSAQHRAAEILSNENAPAATLAPSYPAGSYTVGSTEIEPELVVDCFA